MVFADRSVGHSNRKTKGKTKMTNDTLKSLGFLKKSLKMNGKALGNNMTQDGIPVPELQAFADHAKAMVTQIEAWEKANASAAPTIPGIVQPAPAAATVSTVPLSDDDLLTVP
jgi:hypothetical protein